MTPEVECYAGSTYPESPRALVWAGVRFNVENILERRREPDGVGFLVRCTPDRQLFDLFYRFSDTQWLIAPKGWPLNDDDLPIKP